MKETNRPNQRQNRQPAWKKKSNDSKPFTREHKIGPLEVIVRDGDVMQAFHVLEKKMAKEGVLAELKRRRFAEKPSDKKRRKSREAQKKARRATSKSNRNKK